jgi:hypothetical protein
MRCSNRGRPLIVVFGPLHAPVGPIFAPPLSSAAVVVILVVVVGGCAAIVVGSAAMATQRWQRSNDSAAMAEKVAAQRW